MKNRESLQSRVIINDNHKEKKNYFLVEKTHFFGRIATTFWWKKITSYRGGS